MSSQIRRDRAWARELAENVVRQMTLEEKASQMLHSAPAIERLNIPAYNWWNEALHGVARAGTATVFPQAIGLAASFDPELLQSVGEVTSTEGRGKYNDQFKHGDHDIYKGLTFWSPNVNIFRDPRWGRGHETYGEDPYLSGALGVRFIHGLQGDDPRYLKSAACAKHFAVHSGPEDLRHSFNAEVSVKEMRETYLPAFEACVKDGGVEAVMGAYNRVNGEAACASEVLLESILREEWGFEGHVVSDCWAIKDIYEFHGICDTPEEAAALAIMRGCDLNCGVVYQYATKAVEQGLLTEDAITEAVTRLFTTRYLLGIMGDERSTYDAIPYIVTDSKEHRDFNRDVARRTVVLLKNDATLPLTLEGTQTIGVIGPNANSRKALVGNYEGTASRYVTVLEGIQDRAEEVGARVLYSEACHLWKEKVGGLGATHDRLSEVKAICDASDVIVCVMGLDSGLEGEQGDTGNQFGSGDKRDLHFPGLQRSVLETAYSYDKPVILIVMSGSCLALDQDQAASAILQAWYPGAQGGHAIADILFGDVSPEGKLPLSFYSERYEMPEFTDYSMAGRTYRFTRDAILYPFGFGLSYSRFELGKVEVTGAIVEDGEIRIQAEVKNIGERDAAETVQVYVEAPEYGTPFPQLKGLKKVHLRSGQSECVEISIPTRQLRTYNEAGDAVLASGTYRFSIGFNQPDPRSVELTGHQPYVTRLAKA